MSLPIFVTARHSGDFTFIGGKLVSEPGIKDRTSRYTGLAVIPFETLSEPPGAHSGTAPDPKSSRVSWWPYDEAPASVRAMADKLWPVRDNRVRWWVGCCGAYMNPDGFPLFMHAMRSTRRGRYWWALAFVKNATVRYELQDECEAAAESTT